MLTKDSREVIKAFLSHYGSKSSQSNYKSAVKTIFEVTEKNDVRKLTYEDYLNVSGDTSQDIYRTSFFKYVYAFDILENPKGFQNIWVKSNLKRNFQNKLEQPVRKKEKSEYKPSLTIDQIEKIEKFLDVDNADNIDILLLGFCWYMLFNTDCMVDELRKEIDSKDFYDGKIVSGLKKTYKIPSRFHPVLNHFKIRNNHTGFGDLGEYISKLGNYVGIKKLTPRKIKKAREQNMITCATCGKTYFNTLENWIAINGRIVCKRCAQNLKKNYNFNVDNIRDNKIEIFTQDENIKLASVSYTFDTLRQKLIKERDYISIHKFMIQVGKAGESFVYEHERNYLKNTPYFNLVDNTKALNPQNGYDILSYDKEGNKLYIEVKTSVNKDDSFIISDYELRTLKKFKDEGKKYLIYKVSNILAKDKDDIKLEVISDILNNNLYSFETLNWKITKK
jgi:hypothetical protein